jgi:hypothetical protein
MRLCVAFHAVIGVRSGRCARKLASSLYGFLPIRASTVLGEGII